MIPSIRELELEEKVARLQQRVHELESRQGPITIDEAALDLSTVQEVGNYPLYPYITVRANHYLDPGDPTHNFQAIWSRTTENESWQVLYKADRVLYTRQAEDRIYDHMLRAALSHVIHRP